MPAPGNTLSDIGISESDVFEALSSLDPNKAMEIDGIGPKILKHCALALFKPLHHLFLLRLSQHYLPEDWRCHLIVPVFKSGNKSSVRNYRPISLLCTISKVVEKLIYDKIIQFVSSSISPSQFSFRPMHSSIQQLLVFLSIIQDSLATNSQADAVYLDLRKVRWPIGAIIPFSISRFHFPFFAAIFQFVLLFSIFALPFSFSLPSSLCLHFLL